MYECPCCGIHPADERLPDWFCSLCHLQAKVEFAKGMVQLNAYLAKQARFESFLNERGQR